MAKTVLKSIRSAKVTPVRTKPKVTRRVAVARKAKPVPKPMPKPAPVVPVTQAKARESWKAQAQHAADIVKSQHGAVLDQRAHVRAIDGHRWAARKPR